MTKNTMQGALIGLVLAIGIYTFRFQMDDTLKNAEDVEKVFGVIPLSVIPEGNIEGKSGMIGKPPRMGIKRKKGKTYAG
jgi:hypothetical protein